MPNLVSSFVDAALQSDVVALRKAVATTESSDSSRKYFVAIAESMEGTNATAADMRSGLQQLCSLLIAPPEDVELFQILLAQIVRVACWLGNIGEARRAMRLLESIGRREKDRPEIRATVLRRKATIQEFLGKFDEAFELRTAAVEVLGQREDRLWFECKGARLMSALHMLRPDVAEHDLMDTKAIAESDEELRSTWHELRIFFLDLCGRQDEALAFPLPEGTGEIGRAINLAARLRMMVFAHRGAEALALAVKHRAEITPVQFEMVHGLEAIVRGDLEAARNRFRKLISSPGARPRDVQNTAYMLACVELCTRRPKAARLLLTNVDADRRRGRHQLEWTRLCLLEGDERQAVEHFRNVLEQCAGRPEMLRDKLQACHELTGAQLARLWTLAGRPAETQAQAPVAPAEASAATAGTPTAPAPAGGKALVGEAPAMRKVRTDIGRFAPLDETVLVTGETGTGKELTARILHDAGPRRELPFVAVNCAAISDTLLESEMFGHVKGAFTGAERAHDGLLIAAGGGTIFLDEIGSMSPRLQGALLRVLEERKVRPVGGTRPVPLRARLVAATNQPLEDLVKAGSFRQDLYYRLAKLEIRLPPLRERRDDILPLVRHFLRGYFPDGNVAVGDDLLEALRQHDWPGNVRELANAVQRMVIMAGDVKILGAGLFLARAEGSAPKGREETAGPAATEAPRRPGLRGARGRLAALRRLFEEHRELSRGDAAGLLGCAGGTAAKLLAALQAEGLITRIEPTPVARTHYFRLRSSQS